MHIAYMLIYILAFLYLQKTQSLLHSKDQWDNALYHSIN